MLCVASRKVNIIISIEFVINLKMSTPYAWLLPYRGYNLRGTILRTIKFAI